MAMNVDKEIAKAHLLASGWELNDFHSSNPIECHIVYVHDFRCNKIKMFCIECDQFSTSHGSPSIDASVNVLSHLLTKSFAGSLSQRESGVLSSAMIDYLRETGCYRKWRSEAPYNARMHAILNIYAGSGQPWVRPFIIRCDQVVIEAQEVIAMTKEVSKVDKVNHPEWF